MSERPDKTTGPRAMTDRDIAIAHLTLADAENVDGVETWRDHWRRHFDDMAARKHSGDCTKQPWTCSRCLAEDAMKMVPVYRALFGVPKP